MKRKLVMIMLSIGVILSLCACGSHKGTITINGQEYELTPVEDDEDEDEDDDDQKKESAKEDKEDKEDSDDKDDSNDKDDKEDSDETTSSKDNEDEEDDDVDKKDEKDEKDDDEDKEDEDISEDEKEEKPSKKTDTADISDDWMDYEVSINGTKITLPCSYEEFSEVTGLSIKSSLAKSYLEGGYYTTANMYDKDENLAMYIELINETDEDALYTDCKVIKIGYTDSMKEYTNDKNKIVFANGIEVGQEITVEEIKELFGEPSDLYEYESEDSDYWSKTLTYCDEDAWISTYNKFEIDITNGIIDMITLRHLSY